MDNWDKFFLRLKAVANNCQVDKREVSFSGRKKHEFGGQGITFIDLMLIRSTGGVLLGWQKPERRPLEPATFDCTLLDLEPIPGGWNGVIIALKRERGPQIERTLVVKDGEPRGWLRPNVLKAGIG